MALTGGPVLLTFELVDRDGRVPADPGPVSLQITLGGSCTFRDIALEGIILDGAGTSTLRIALHGGRARVLVSDRAAEQVTVDARRLPEDGPPLQPATYALRFLDPQADEDGDGLNNLEEFELGTSPLLTDSDGDSVADSRDDCPAVPNPDQSDTRHANGIGDACDDPDLDGIHDLVDNCPDRANSDQRDDDGDGTGDACAVGDPRAVLAGIAFSLPFAATDAAYDPQRPYLYVSDKAGRKVSFVNLATGLIEKQFSFDLMPESLALTPDGSRLFVALLTREHSSYWWDEDGHEGYIASFDLQTQVKDRQFHITEDPFDLLATDDGYLVVSSGSGQWTYVRVFNAVTGALTGTTSSNIYERSRLALHPSGKIVYCADTSLSPSDLFRLDLQPGGKIVYRWDSPYHGDHRMSGNVWPSPLGDTLVTRGGDIFTVGDTSSTDMRFVQSLSAGSVEAVVFDAPRQVIFTVEASALRYYNLVSRLEIGSQLLAGSGSFLGLRDDTLYALVRGTGQSTVLAIPHPALAGATNTPPVALFTVTPATGGTTLSDFRFDASSSSDTEDPVTALQFRWDFNNDGAWDTPFSGNPVVTRRFATAGTKIVRLQVRDTLALVSEQTRTLDVAFEADPGQPGPSTPAFELPFPVADAVVDPQHPYLYVSDKAGRKVYFVNLTTGFIEKQFSFDLMPEALALTPDGSRLFVALLAREHSSYWWDEDGHEGYIASFDLQTQVKDRQFRITEDPFDLLATDDGYLVVSSGSGQWTYVRVFDAVTGALTGTTSSSIYERSRLALHPSGKIVYCADTSLSPSDIFRLDLQPGGGIVYRWDSPYHGDHRMSGGVWASPLGDVVITRGGDIFTVGDTSSTDMRFVQSLSAGSIGALAFDAFRRVIFTAEGSTLRYYNLVSRLEIGNQALGGAISFLGVRGDMVYALVGGTSQTTVLAIPHPALAGATNTAPVALFTVTPATGGTTLSDFRFDASSSSDTEDPVTALQFRWDFNNDGAWDTSFSSTPLATKRFATAGTKVVRLQVRDTLALISEQTRTLDVAFEADPGQPGPSTPAFELPFPVADAVIDPQHPYLYVSDKAGRKVYFVNLKTGFIEKQFSFDLMPEALALTPDGSRLFVALLTREHSSYWWNENGHEGYIASFDLQAQVKDRQFRITEDPYDVVATGDGYLVVSSGSGQWTYVRVFNAVTGALTGSTYSSIYERARLALYPSGKIVYCADTSLSPSDIFRLDLQPGGTIAYRWDSPYHGDHRMSGNVWPSPRGDVLVTRGGDVFTANGGGYGSDMLFLRSLSSSSITDLAWDVTRDLVITLEANTLRRYRLSNYTLVESTTLSASGTFLGRHGPALFALVPQDSRTLVIRKPVQNRPPTASAAPGGVLECTGSRAARVSLDASTSTDPDSLPGTQDDIAAFEWYEYYGTSAQRRLGAGAALDVSLPLGTHLVTLKVTDWAGASGLAPVTVTVADTTPPVLDCPGAGAAAGVTAECTGPDGARVPLAATAFDACDGTATIVNGRTGGGADASGVYPLGLTRVVFQAADVTGNRAACTVPVSVVDTTPPVLDCAAALPAAECTGAGAAQVAVGVAAHDLCGGVTVTNDHTGNGADASGPYPLGETTVGFRAIDASGRESTCSTAVTVVDTVPPTFAVEASPRTLWPPNHQMVPVAVTWKTFDVCDPSRVTVQLASAASSEPDDADGSGDGATTHDVQGTDIGAPGFGVLLRAERDGAGPGRVYSLSYVARDGSGNATPGLATVVVPHDQGDGPGDPVDIRVRQEPDTTVIEWNPVPGAVAYRGIRGTIGDLKGNARAFMLDPFHCMGPAFTEARLEVREDVPEPPLGEAYFYLIAYDDGLRGGTGPISAAGEHLGNATDCK